MSLIVRLQDLDIKETKDYDLSPEELELKDLRLKNRVRASLELFKGKNFVRVQGRVKTSVALDCSRCLEALDCTIDERFELDYVLGKDPYQRMEQIELKKDDINRVYFLGDSIDLSIGIRETILLSIPIAPLCKENCAGICHHCGKNLNKGKCDCK